jgi:hypothetical protein
VDFLADPFKHVDGSGALVVSSAAILSLTSNKKVTGSVV